VTLPWATLTTILEGVGVLMSATGIGGAVGMTAAVFTRRSSDVTDRWFQIGTAFGFAVGVPLAILVFISLQRIF
jgi:hypothetical protein